ncbi:MAG: tRNA (adenosine(37)-N6)-threonylcarbamoyltransferase complex ATPase subunit type 1 TsaE, partial [Candidatus Desulforudaceae bacterium]
GAADFALLGYEEYFYDEGVSLVEWADRVTEVLPRERLDIEIEADGEERRRLCFNPHGKRYLALVEDLKKHARTWD